MLYNVAIVLFALALIVGAGALIVVLLSFAVRLIRRKIGIYGLVGSFSVAVVALILAAVTEPPTAAAPTPPNAVRHVAAAHKPVPKHVLANDSNFYAGETPATIAARYNLSNRETSIVAHTQSACARAHKHDDTTRAAKDSMGVAIALEVVAQEWDACDFSIQQTIDVVKPLHALSDYDYVGAFGVLPSHPLLQEAGAYGSAGTEWEQFGEQQRAIEDLQNAVDVGRKMVSRGYSDEGHVVIIDNESELRNAESQPVR